MADQACWSPAMMDPRLGVLQTLWLYSDHMTAGRIDALSRLFTADGVLAIPSAELIGPSQIEEHLSATQRRREPIVNLVLNPVVSIDGDRASARSSFLVLGRAAQLELQLFGHYVDDLAAVKDAWLFRCRSVEPLGSLPGWASSLDAPPSGTPAHRPATPGTAQA
jgi:hypothetical protein